MRSSHINQDLPAITEDLTQTITQGNFKVAPQRGNRQAQAGSQTRAGDLDRAIQGKYFHSRRQTEDSRRGQSLLQRQQQTIPATSSVLGGSALRPLFSPIAPVQRYDIALLQGLNQAVPPDQRAAFRQNQGKITPQQQIQIIGGNYQLVNQNLHNFQNSMRTGSTKNAQRGPPERNATPSQSERMDLEVQARGFKNAISFNQRSSSIQPCKMRPDATNRTKQSLRLEQLHEPASILQLQAITAETARHIRQQQRKRNAVTALRPLNKTMDQSSIPPIHEISTKTNAMQIDLQINGAYSKNTARRSDRSSYSNQNQSTSKKTPREHREAQQKESGLENWQKMKIQNQEKFKQFQVVNEQQLISQIMNSKNGSKEGRVDRSGQNSQYQQSGINSGDLHQFQQQYQEYLRMMQPNHSIRNQNQWNQQDPAGSSNEDKDAAINEQNRNAFAAIIQGLQLQSLNIQNAANVHNFQEAIKQIKEYQVNQTQSQSSQSTNKFQDKINQEQARKALTAFVLSESQRHTQVDANGEGQQPRGHRHRQHEEAPEAPVAARSANDSASGRGDVNPSKVSKNLKGNSLTAGEAMISRNDFQNIVRTRTLSMISESKKYATEAAPDQANSPLGKDKKLKTKDKSETRSGGAHNWPGSGDGTLSAGRQNKRPCMQFKSGQQSRDSKLQPASKSKKVLETKTMNFDQTLPQVSSRTQGVDNSRSNDEMSQEAHSKSFKMHYQVSIDKKKEGDDDEQRLSINKKREQRSTSQQKHVDNNQHLQTLLIQKQSTRKIKDERVKEYKVLGKATKIESGETKIICHDNQHETSGTLQTYKAFQQSYRQDSRNEISIDNLAQGIASQDLIKNERDSQVILDQPGQKVDFNLKFSPHSSKSNKKNLKLVLNFSNDNGGQNRGETALLTDNENTGEYSDGRRIDGVKEPRFPQIEIQSKKSNMSTQGEGVIMIDGINRGGTNSLHEIADGLSLSAGETQTNLQPQYYLNTQNNGQNLVDPHSKFKALNGYVQNQATSNERRKITMGSRTIELPNHNYQFTIQEQPKVIPATFTESYQNSSNQNSVTQQMDAHTFTVDLVHQQLYKYFDRNKINRILQMNTNQNNNQFQLALSKFDRSNKKRPFKSKNKNKDLRFENGQPNPFVSKVGVLPTSLQQRSFVAPLGSLPEDQSYIKAIKNISQALNNANNSRIKIQNKEVLENVKKVIPYLDTSIFKNRSQKARTPFILERDLKNQNGIDFKPNPESANKGTDLQDFSQQVSHVPPATAGPSMARISQQRILKCPTKEKTPKPDVPSLHSPLIEMAHTTRTATANVDTSQKNSINTNRSSLKSNFRSTLNEQQQYQENLLNLFLKENKDFRIDKTGRPWPSDSTPMPNMTKGILNPDWKECLFNQDLIKKGVPVEKILEDSQNQYILDSKAFILTQYGDMTHRSGMNQQQIFTNEAITQLSKDEAAEAGGYGPSLTSRSFEKKTKYQDKGTYSDNISIVDHRGNKDKILVQTSPSHFKESFIQTPLINGCRTGRSQESKISGGKKGAWRISPQGRASKLQKDQENSLMDQSIAMTQRSCFSSNATPRSRTAEYEFRLLNCRNNDKFAKKENGIQKLKPDIAKISLAKRRPIDIEKKQCDKNESARNMEMFEQQESLQENNESLVNLKIIQNQSAKLEEPSVEWPKTKLKSRLVHDPNGKGAFVLDNLLDVRMPDNERRSVQKESEKKRSSQKSGRESDLNARKVTIRHKSPSQGERMSNQSQGNNNDNSQLISSQERERIIVGGNLEHASRNTASMDKDRKSESIRRTIHDSNHLSFDVHGTGLERNPGNKSEISKSSGGTRNHDCLGIRVGQDSIYNKSIQDAPLTTREQQTNTEITQQRIIIAKNALDKSKMLSKHGPGKIVGIRGNPNKEWMTNTTKDGRKFTQSLVRPLMLQELQMKQNMATFEEIGQFTEMEMNGRSVIELHRMRQASKQNGSLTERTQGGEGQPRDISKSILKGYSKGTQRSRQGSRQSIMQDRQSPKQGAMLLSPRFGPNTFNEQQLRTHNRPTTKFDPHGDCPQAKERSQKNEQIVQQDSDNMGQMRQQLNTQGVSRNGQMQSVTHDNQQEDHQTLIVETTGKAAPTLVSQIQAQDFNGKESAQDNGQEGYDENVSQWQGEMVDEVPANPIADLVATKRSEKSKEAENQSKSSKSNRQQIHLKRGLKIDSKIGSGNATNSDMAKDQDNFNTDRGEQIEGNIDQILANEPLHSQRDTPILEPNYDAESSPRRHQEVQAQLRDAAANTDRMSSLNGGGQQIWKKVSYYQGEREFIEEYVQRHEQDGTIVKLIDEAKKLDTDKNFRKGAYTYQASVNIDKILLQSLKGKERQGQDKEDDSDSKEILKPQKRVVHHQNADGRRDLVQILTGPASPNARPKRLREPQVLKVSRGQGTEKPQLEMIPDSPILHILQQKASMKSKTHCGSRAASREAYSYALSSLADQSQTRCLNSPRVATTNNSFENSPNYVKS